jgi:antitoxin (DNA-binding transcriptional repressor) of toxin-antitoxin stability system
MSAQDLERDLLAFLRRVEAGESFLVVSGAHPLAEVRPVAGPATEPRPFGLCAGSFTVPLTLTAHCPTTSSTNSRGHEAPARYPRLFDRILIAQTLQQGMKLVTIDELVRAYPVPLLPIA